MARRILVVDRNAAFATMLKEMLESEGGYQVDVASGAREALILLNGQQFDLTIVDMDLDGREMGYQNLIRSVRKMHPDMRLVLIPLMGQVLPAEAHQLNIQGALSKPFFADDLLSNIQDALSRQVQGSPFAPVAAPPKEPAPGVQAILTNLGHETQADVVVLFELSGEARIVAHSGGRTESAVALANASRATVVAAQGLARLLGHPEGPFEHNMFENESSRVYILALPHNRALVLATPLRTPLGTVRQNLRRAGRDLSESH